MKIFNTVTFLMVLCALSFAGIIRVPQDQPTIQDGINAAVSGDTVLVADNTYYENINFNGKAIIVASYMLMDNDSTHRDNTIIDGSQPANPNIGSVVSFVSGEDTNSVIYGFTITGGTGTLYNSNNRIGGGIYYKYSGASIIHNKIVFNSVNHNQDCYGGGIGTLTGLHDLHQIVIKNNIIESNTITAGHASRGGGISIIAGKIIGNRIRFNSCYATTSNAAGGAITNYCDTTFHRTLVIIDSNIITHNLVNSTQANGIGGGVDIQMSNVHLTSNLISHNNISGIYPSGCGIRIIFSREISIVKDNIISHNSYINGSCWGGGVDAYQTIGLTIEGNRFINNVTYTGGGGVSDMYTEGSVISGNEFIDNESQNIFGAGGGAIVCYSSDNITVKGNLIKQNSSYYGGGLASQNCDLLMINNLFIQNQAQGGGAICVFQVPPIPSITNAMWNNTIIGNVADSAGGIWLGGLTLKVMNNICWGNTAPFAPEIYVQEGIMDISYSDIRFGADSIQVAAGATLNWLSGNIDADPQLMDSVLTSGDTLFCTLPAGSPCIDTGDPDPAFNDPEDPNNPGFALWPSMGTVRNDMGAYGGPGASGWITGIEDKFELGAEIPTGFQLSQNYPNPFNPTTTIEFSLVHSGFVTLKIYNILGEKVVTLVSGDLRTGTYKYEWDASGLASGVYFYRLETKAFTQTKKMLLVR